jgi:hypothetical protein
VLALVFVGVACVSLVLLVAPYNIYDHPDEHSLFATLFFGSVYVHILYVASECLAMSDKNGWESFMLLMAFLATLVIGMLSLSRADDVCERCTDWFAPSEVSYIFILVAYAYAFRQITNEKPRSSAAAVVDMAEEAKTLMCI